MVIRTLSYYYHEAGPWDHEAGERWYSDARRIAVDLAETYNVTVEAAVAVIAVLSQRQRWQRNLVLAQEALAGQRMSGIFTHQRVKVEQILAGDPPADVVRGPKIIAFYHAILGDEDAVVLDTWMLEVMGKLKPTIRQYERLADRLRAQALDAGVTPAAFQAVVWCHIRGGSS